MLLSKIFDGIGNVKIPNDVEIKGITNNTKEIKQGFLYVCIVGAKRDGHDFANEALNNGAVAVVCQKALGLKNEIVVESTSKIYSLLCFNFYDNPQQKLKLIGITGTNGKTSTAFIVRDILGRLGEKCGYIGTVENYVGSQSYEANLTTPDSLEIAKLFSEMVENGCKYAVIEVSSHALVQERLSACLFDIAVFTNLTEEHLDYHGNMKNYLSAKKKLFYKTKKAIMNVDDQYFSDISADLGCEIITYSTKNRSADYMAENIVSDLSGVRYELMAGNELIRVYFSTPGKISAYNTEAAIAVCRELGYPLTKIAESVKGVKGIKGRLEILNTEGKNFGIIIDYAHTPDGMYKTLKTVKSFTKGKLIVLFGCGGDRDKSKRAKMGEIASFFADSVIVTDDNPRTEEPMSIINDIVKGIKGEYKIIENRENAIKVAVEEAKKDDIIVLLGKGHETYQIIGNKKRFFDEREIVKKYLFTVGE